MPNIMGGGGGQHTLSITCSTGIGNHPLKDLAIPYSEKSHILLYLKQVFK